MKIIYKLISAMTVCLLVISVTLSVSAETSVNNMMDLQNIIELDIFTYSEDLEIKENYSGAEKAVIFEKGTLFYEFSVSETSTYNLFLDYKVISDNDMNAEISVLIDGEVPFEGAERIEIRKMWTDGGEIRKDNYGNEFTPEQSEYDGFVNTAVYDATGIISEPYLFNLSKGEHTITLELKDGKIALSGITFEAVENTDRTYKDIETEYKENGYKAYEGKTLVLEGENAWLKNSDSIIALADNSSKILTPSSATHSKINYIGSSNWKNLNDEITWQIDIPEDGLYKLGFMCKQDQTINGNAYRSLKIDGKTPFKEAKAITFGYDINWKFKEFSDVDDEPYLFYLTKGEHTLSLSVTLGPTADFYARLKEVTQTLGDLYIDMVMITGETPDKNRDYELHKQIPDFLETLKNTNKTINDIAVDMQELTGEGTNSQIAALKNMSRVLESMVKNSYTAHIYMQDFYSNYTTVSSWLYEMTMMPLSIDQIRIAAPDKAFEEKSVSFGEKLIFAIKRFLVSFTEEYQSSKIKNDNDLFFINTLGFRGEALPSIASVSKVTLKTCANEIGTKVVIEGGNLISHESSDARSGTEITVDDLFFNTPARLKYLKSETSELSYIISYLEKLSLSNPNIKFALTNNEKVLLKTSGSNDLLKTIYEIYGYMISSNMII